MTIKTIALATVMSAVGLHAAAPFAAAQNTPYKPPTAYKDYYSSRVQTTRTSRVSAADYTYDRMFYKNSAVSPYTNLMRPSSQYTNNYMAYVKPEQQRRDAQAALEHKAWKSSPSAGGTGSLHTGGGASKPSAYQNRWYGGRQALGLE